MDRITGQLGDGQQRRELSKTRKAVAVVFASLVLMSGFGAAAFAAAGGNGNGNNGNGNGNSGTPAGCVEGQGQLVIQRPVAERRREELGLPAGLVRVVRRCSNSAAETSTGLRELGSRSAAADPQGRFVRGGENRRHALHLGFQSTSGVITSRCS